MKNNIPIFTKKERFIRNTKEVALFILIFAVFYFIFSSKFSNELSGIFAFIFTWLFYLSKPAKKFEPFYITIQPKWWEILKYKGFIKDLKEWEEIRDKHNKDGFFTKDYCFTFIGENLIFESKQKYFLGRIHLGDDIPAIQGKIKHQNPTGAAMLCIDLDWVGGALKFVYLDKDEEVLAKFPIRELIDYYGYDLSSREYEQTKKAREDLGWKIIKNKYDDIFSPISLEHKYFKVYYNNLRW